MITFVPNVYRLIALGIFFFASFFAYSENTRIVDVHVGLIDPSGRIYDYPDWNTSLSPRFPLVELPAGFEFPAAPVAEIIKE